MRGDDDADHPLGQPAVRAALTLAPVDISGRATIGSVLPTCTCSSAAPFWSMAISPAGLPVAAARRAPWARPPGARAAHRRAPRRPRHRARRAGCSGRCPRPPRPHPAAGPAPGSSRPARSRRARQARRRPSSRGGSADRHCWCAMPPRPRPGRPPADRDQQGEQRPSAPPARIACTATRRTAAIRSGGPRVVVWDVAHGSENRQRVKPRRGCSRAARGGAATTTPFVLAPFPPGGTGWRNKGQRSGQRPRNSWRADTVHPAVPGCRGTVGGSRGGRA